MKLLLIAPTIEQERYPRGGYAFRVASYTMPLIAALTPPNIDVTIADECVSKIPFDQDFDLVAITVNTPLAPYAYELAARFRAAGSKVVLGGIHPSQLPYESLRYSDSVVIGEAEPIWSQLLRDFDNGQMQRVYRSRRADLRRVPTPRWNLLESNKYIISRSLTATRGCDHSCSYCSIGLSIGPGFRTRPVEHVVRDIERSGARRLMFWDDNLTADKEYCRQLFAAIKPLKIKWVSQATIQFTDDESLVRLAGEAGCTGIFIGFESLSAECLDECGKTFNRSYAYQKAVRMLQDYGICVSAGFVFGFDHDGPDCFERTLDFAVRVGIDACNFKILTPYPGTKLFDKLRKGGRIFDYNWSHYRGKKHVVFQPKRMTPVELLNGFRWIRRQCYSWKSIILRLFRSRASISASLPMNLGYRYIITKDDREPGWNPCSPGGRRAASQSTEACDEHAEID